MTIPQTEQYSMQDPRLQTLSDSLYKKDLSAFFETSLGGTIDKLRNFTKFVPRQVLCQFLAKAEIFKEILSVHGNIIECGVHLGGGLMTWGNLSAMFEPYNHTRRIIGFDTFNGFTGIHPKDQGDVLECSKIGGLAVPSYDDLTECIRLYDLNRPIGHIPRIELVSGDALETMPKYVAANNYLVVAMLYLDFDLYDPTKRALEVFLPRMPKGAVVVFDELNQAAWPGESAAVIESVGLSNLRIRRFSFAPALSYAVIE